MILGKSYKTWRYQENHTKHEDIKKIIQNMKISRKSYKTWRYEENNAAHEVI
jgi:hypothetical protein